MQEMTCCSPLQMPVELFGLHDVGLDDAQAGMLDDPQLALPQDQRGDMVAAGEGLADQFAAEDAAGSGNEEVHRTYSMSHSLAGRDTVTDTGCVAELAVFFGDDAAAGDAVGLGIAEADGLRGRIACGRRS